MTGSIRGSKAKPSATSTANNRCRPPSAVICWRPRTTHTAPAAFYIPLSAPPSSTSRWPWKRKPTGPQGQGDRHPRGTPPPIRLSAGSHSTAEHVRCWPASPETGSRPRHTSRPRPKVQGQLASPVTSGSSPSLCERLWGGHRAGGLMARGPQEGGKWHQVNF